MLLGFAFFPMFFLGAYLFWSIVQDKLEAPEQLAFQAELDELARAPVSAKELRDLCESPAEVAFLDAMITAYALKTGQGALEGNGLRLISQKGLGTFNIKRHGSSYQYRADFLIDNQLLVEIDGAAYHSSPEAVARDLKRDADLALEGYQTLRIPAQVVFKNPSRAVSAVENARASIKLNRPSQAKHEIASPISSDGPQERHSFLSRISETIDTLEVRSKQFYTAAVIEAAAHAIFNDIEALVESASEVVALTISPVTASEDERREANGIWLRKMVEAINVEPRSLIEKQTAVSKAIDVISRSVDKDYCKLAIERSVDAHMSRLKIAHDNIFPELEAFPNDVRTGMSQRDILIKELWAVFSNDSELTQFHHPYVPLTKGKLLFTAWWRQHVAGDEPLTRSFKNWIASPESDTQK